MGEKKRRPPNTKFTKANVDRILQLAKLLTPKEFIAKAVGITPKTLNKWLNDHKRLPWKMKVAETEHGEPIMGRPLFDVVYKKAEAEGVGYNLGLVQQAGKRSWQAACWLLERRHPVYFGKVERGAVAGGQKKDRPQLPPDAVRALEGLDPNALRRFREFVKQSKVRATQPGQGQQLRKVT